MPMLSHEDLKTVATHSHRPALSIFLPTHRAGREIRQDLIRLKNLLKQAENHLTTEGARTVETQELLAPVEQLLDDENFWRHQSDGLAIFRSSELFRIYGVPDTVHELVSVSDRFNITPLLPQLIHDQAFFILALSQKKIRLIECSRDHAHEVHIPDLPSSMDDTLPEGTSPQVQRHTLPMDGRGSARFHRHGVGTDDVDVVNLTRYFHRIHDALQPTFAHQGAPVVMACVEYLAPLYREVSRYPRILNAIIPGNPDGLSDQELFHKAWPVVEGHLRKNENLAIAQFHEGLSKGRASHSIKDIVIAAHQGRIDTLFVNLGIQWWGRFDFDTLFFEQHDIQQPGDEEFLNLAAIQTLIHGGSVYGEVPNNEMIAAVFRF